MKTNLSRQFFTIALLLSVAIAVTIHFPMILDYLFEKGGHNHRNVREMVTFSHMSSELLITFLVAFSMFVLNYFILKPVEKHRKLNFKMLVSYVLLNVVIVFVLNYLLFSFLNLINPDNQYNTFFDEFISINFFVSALVVGCVIIIHLVYQKQTVQLENEVLRSEALRSQLESLKNQMSPHFLFNSLAALKSLIKVKPETAEYYVNHLSKALRYTLQSNEKQSVTLKEELEFTESYLFLIKLRFNTGLNVSIEIGDEYLNYRLPPLTMQTLVENAVKHNEISKKNPLAISIETCSSDILAVSNNIQLKITQETGSGIGLLSLAKLFRLLFEKEITITRENNVFRVEVPLIRPIGNESTDN